MSEAKINPPCTAPLLDRLPLLFPLLVAIPLMLVCLTFPIAPVELDVDADTSFSMAVNDARLHGLHLGTDLVHTYGPLGYLIFIYYAPQVVVSRMISDVLVTYAVAAGVCLVAWRLAWPSRVALVAICAYLSANVHPRMDLLIDIGSFCWGLLCCLEQGRRLKAAAFVFASFAAYAALGKNSMLFMGGLSLGLLALILSERGQWRVGLAMVFGFLMAIAAGWLSVGHGLANLKEAAVNAISIVGGYNLAMGWDVLSLTLHVGIAVVAVALPMVAIRSFNAFPQTLPRPMLKRLLLFSWLCALLFLDWKHGFVRGDIWHVAYFFGFVPIFALALNALPGFNLNASRFCTGLAVTCTVLCLGVLQNQYLPTWKTALRAPFYAFVEHVSDLFYPPGYIRRMDAEVEVARQKADLPKLREIVKDSTMDVFGQMQIYPLLNGLKYKPRPGFQSYVIYNAHLASLNEAFYLSTNAPDYLLFRLCPTDRRFPSLEDARLFRDVLYNFEFVADTGAFVVLKPNKRMAIDLTLEKEGTAKPGEIIPLPKSGDTNLWMEIEVVPTLAGRAQQILYRPTTVRLGAWKNGKLLLRKRAPPIMMAGGFLASPLVSNNQDAVRYFTGGTVVRPDGYSVEIEPGQDGYWNPLIHYRLYRIENPPNRPLRMQVPSGENGQRLDSEY